MRIAVCGHGRAGKDTVSEWLRDYTNLRYVASTSQAAAPMMFERMAERGHAYPSVIACFEDRHNHRELWAETIWGHNKPNGTKLYEEMVATNDLINGIRRRWELEQCIRWRVIDRAVWVDSNVPPDPSNEITPDDCQYVIDNYGALHELPREVLKFAIGLRDRGYDLQVKDSCLRL